MGDGLHLMTTVLVAFVFGMPNVLGLGNVPTQKVPCRSYSPHPMSLNLILTLGGGGAWDEVVAMLAGLMYEVEAIGLVLVVALLYGQKVWLWPSRKLQYWKG